MMKRSKRNTFLTASDHEAALRKAGFDQVRQVCAIVRLEDVCRQSARGASDLVVRQLIACVVSMEV